METLKKIVLLCGVAVTVLITSSSELASGQLLSLASSTWSEPLAVGLFGLAVLGTASAFKRLRLQPRRRATRYEGAIRLHTEGQESARLATFRSRTDILPAGIGAKLKYE